MNIFGYIAVFMIVLLLIVHGIGLAFWSAEVFYEAKSKFINLRDSKQQNYCKSCNKAIKPKHPLLELVRFNGKPRN